MFCSAHDLTGSVFRSIVSSAVAEKCRHEAAQCLSRPTTDPFSGDPLHFVARQLSDLDIVIRIVEVHLGYQIHGLIRVPNVLGRDLIVLFSPK